MAYSETICSLHFVQEIADQWWYRNWYDRNPDSNILIFMVIKGKENHTKQLLGHYNWAIGACLYTRQNSQWISIIMLSMLWCMHVWIWGQYLKLYAMKSKELIIIHCTCDKTDMVYFWEKLLIFTWLVCLWLTQHILYWN